MSIHPRPRHLAQLIIAGGLTLVIACSSDGGSTAPTTVPASSTTTSAPQAPTTTRPTTIVAAGARTFTVADGLASNEVIRVDVNEDGTTWALARRDDFATSFARLEDDRWVIHDPPSTLFGDVQLAAGPDGSAWVIGGGFAGSFGLWEFDGDTWIVHTDCSEQGLAEGFCRRGVTEPANGAVGGDGELWAHGFSSDAETVDCGFLHREGDGWVAFPAEPPTEGVGFTGFCPGDDFGPDGHPYALKADGIFRLDVDGWTRLADTGGTEQFRDKAVGEWAVGSGDVVWAIRFAEAELLLVWERFDGSTWTTLPIGTEGIGNLFIDQTCVLAEDPSLDPGELDAQLSDPIERVYFVNSRLLPLEVDPDGGVWTAVRCSGVTLTDPSDGSVADSLTVEDGLASLRITDLEVGPDGTVWVATLDGLTRVVR